MQHPPLFLVRIPTWEALNPNPGGDDFKCARPGAVNKNDGAVQTEDDGVAEQQAPGCVLSFLLWVSTCTGGKLALVSVLLQHLTCHAVCLIHSPLLSEVTDMWHTLSIHGAFWSPDEAEFAAKIEEVRTELGHWEKYLSKTQYLAGAAFTLADVYAGTPYALQKPMKDSSIRHACCESCSAKSEPIKLP